MIEFPVKLEVDWLINLFGWLICGGFTNYRQNSALINFTTGITDFDRKYTSNHSHLDFLWLAWLAPRLFIDYFEFHDIYLFTYRYPVSNEVEDY